jgi:hypothetical protein
VSKPKSRIAGAMKSDSKMPKTVIRLASGAEEHVKFGAVTIAAAQFDQKIAQCNVEKGQRALARAAKKLAQPGVSIRAAKDIPLYSVDETHPNQLVRKLNGKVEHGVLENGHFIPVDE